MTYHSRLTAGDAFRSPSMIDEVRKFLDEQGTAVANAARALGGNAGSSRVFILIEAVRDATQLTRVHKLQLIELHKILSLEYVGDPDRVETALFNEIDLNSSMVSEVCLLTESLEALLLQIS